MWNLSNNQKNLLGLTDIEKRLIARGRGWGWTKQVKGAERNKLPVTQLVSWDVMYKMVTVVNNTVLRI